MPERIVKLEMEIVRLCGLLEDKEAESARLLAQAERRLRYIMETQQLLGTHDNIQVAVESLLQERDSLRAQLAEAERERDIHESVATARQSLLDGIADQLGVAPFSISNIHVAIDQLAAQVERLRIVTNKLAHDASVVVSEEFGGSDPEDSPVSVQTLDACIDVVRKVLAETPEQSLAAVREQARREALTEAAPIVRASILQWVVKAGHDPRSAIGDWALNTADIISEEIRELATRPAKEPQP